MIDIELVLVIRLVAVLVTDAFISWWLHEDINDFSAIIFFLLKLSQNFGNSTAM